SAGSITFTVSNKGTQVHEFVVVKTDTMAADIAIVDNKVDESSLTAIDEVEDIAVGDSPTLTVDLQPGHYVLLCNIETHYGQGMHADFDVN
ncbi:MAG: plastocyanin/azurin family copper-binding protein, partial [Chloroflexota bacterium]